MDTKKLRQKILDLAIHGKLVPQDPNDEPASVLLERIHAEKERLIAEGKIKRSKKSATSDTSHYENAPFEVPENWLSVRVEDVCIFESGFAFNSDSYKAKGQPLVRISNIKEGVVDLDGCVYVDPVEDSRFEVNSGDLLIAMSGATTGKMGIYKNNSPALLNQRVGNIKTISNNILLSEYRNLIMQSLEPQIIKDAYGGAQPNISAKNICAYSICLPPLQEQKRIVLVVGQLFSLIDSIEIGADILKQNIGKAKLKILDLAIHGKLVPQKANDEPASELLKRINPKAITSCDNPHYAEPYELPDGWTWCKLMDLCTFLSRGKSPKYSETDTTYPVFAQKCNLKDGGISLENARFLDPASVERWPDVYHLLTGDVLVNSTGTGTVGRTRLFNESCLGSYPFVVPDSHVSVIRTHSDIVSEYIFALMSSSWIQTYLEDNLAGSTNQKELYIGVLQNVDVPLPPIMEQRRIADKIESLYQQLDSIFKHL